MLLLRNAANEGFQTATTGDDSPVQTYARRDGRRKSGGSKPPASKLGVGEAIDGRAREEKLDPLGLEPRT